jgi:histidinol dehydrogenase
MRKLDTRQPDFDARLAELLAFESAQDPAVQSAVTAILADVKSRGDAALVEHTRRFDAVDVASVADLEISRAELNRAREALPHAQRDALAAAIERVRTYHEKQVAQSWRYSEEDGTELGQQVTPLDRVGIYVPGGKASYPSSVIMNAVPARVAGVGEIVMAVPTPRGERNNLVLAAAALCGVDRVFALGGAQAVAALAYGTATVPQVDKVVGPGNAYVAAAKRQVFGLVGIDMIAGPSEVLVIADKHNNPEWIAADLLAQAEHDTAAQSILMTDDAAFGRAVEAAVGRQLKTLPRGNIAGESWSVFGAIIELRSLDEAPALADRIAAEHLEIATADPEALSDRIRNAGAIFIGAQTPEMIGDYIAGSNHVLPTSRTARFSSGLGVLDFMKRTSLLKLDGKALAALAPAAMALARAEGLEAHRLSAEIRLKSPSGRPS